MTNPARTARDEWLLATLEGMLTPEQFAELQNMREDSLWAAAVRKEWVNDDQILTALSTRFRMKIANVGQVSPQALEDVTEDLSRRYNILPLAITDSTVEIATSDPHDLDCERTLAFVLGRTVKMALASPSQIKLKLDELFTPETVIEKILDEGFEGVEELEAVSEEAPDEFELSLGQASDQPIIRLVDRIIAKAIQLRSSDIHLEPEETGMMVRYRIDGVLKDDSTIPRPLGTPLVARVKIMATLDIADRLRPQDGRARVSVGGSRVDLRISTLPVSLGEKVVIRILDARHTVLSLENLGLTPFEVERINTMLQVREGMILVTGPTGSGKTTTLYSMIRSIQKRGVNIVTVEDPVEYRLQGIVQVQVNEKTGLTFPAALRSILRQDPDVILVGEVRDRETAQIAIQAALTGHLVLTTLHTIDAASSVTRLTDIGIETYKTAAALKGILAQRLLRRLCPHCKQLVVEEMPERLKKYFPPGSAVYRPGGCSECSNTGYRGRLAITETLIPNAEVERRVAANESPDRIADAAREGGMRTLWESGVEHVKGGMTSVDELARVLEIPDEPAPRPSASVPAPAAPSRPSGMTPASAVNTAAAAPPSIVDAPPPPAVTHDDAPARPSTPIPRHSGPHTAKRDGTLHGAPARPMFEGSAFDLLDEHKPAARTGVPRSVLLVEDEDALRRVVRDLLERDGFIVHEAGDGVVALDQIDRSAPDVVVLDLNLPRLDGYGVLSHLRSRQATRDIPVIVLTAKGDEDSEVRVFEYGATEYITKPFRPRALIARLNALLRR
ncbi:MAG TPA: ATPase, T2SS/T4P/T4SS family [Gemmatimonadaceae bacterium]|nr:ATPase, T2SS/T4P/T4SS family [Gemmatimonadaceae bacterium]